MGPELSAVLPHAPAFSLEATRARSFLERQLRYILHPLCIGIKRREMAPDDFVCLVALETRGARIPADYVAARVQHVDRVVGDCLYEEPVAVIIRLDLFDAICGVHALSSRSPHGSGMCN